LGTLNELPALALAASIGPPATLVVGDVVALSHELFAEAGVEARSFASRR
jgi:siroheme synthase